MENSTPDSVKRFQEDGSQTSTLFDHTPVNLIPLADNKYQPLSKNTPHNFFKTCGLTGRLHTGKFLGYYYSQDFEDRINMIVSRKDDSPFIALNVDPQHIYSKPTDEQLQKAFQDFYKPDEFTPEEMREIFEHGSNRQLILDVSKEFSDKVVLNINDTQVMENIYNGQTVLERNTKNATRMGDAYIENDKKILKLKDPATYKVGN